VEKRKRTVGLVDYDDWLSLLRDALTDDSSGTVACERMARPCVPRRRPINSAA
jgi:exodeoxyribonuclease V beta subunit